MKKKVHGNSLVWRYISLDKFLYLILNKKLYFSKASTLTDKYEGTLPSFSKKEYVNTLLIQGHNDNKAQEMLSDLEQHLEEIRNLTFVNCWTLSKSESYALWKIYLGGSKSGVAIRTTFSKLRKSLEYQEDFAIDLVKYSNHIDPNSLDGSAMDALSILTTKRTYYKYEDELRVLSLNHPELNPNRVKELKDLNGYGVEVDLSTLIQDIYISPFSGKWMFDVVKQIIKLVNPKLNINIKSSEIQDS